MILSDDTPVGEIARLYDLLVGPGFCDFRREDPNDVTTTRWACTAERVLFRRLLEQEGYDVEAALHFANQTGGYCDCEVVWNTLGARSFHDRRGDVLHRMSEADVVARREIR